MAPKNSPRETPFIDHSLAIKRTNGDVVSKFLWRSRESIAEIRLNGDRPLKLEEMQSGAHQTCFSLFDSEDGAKKFSAGNTIHR